MRRCSREATVIRIATVKTRTGDVEGRVYTTEIGRKSPTLPLLNCLDRQPEIDGVGWPS